MRRGVQSVLAAAAMGCALALSASSTVRLVASVGVPGWAHPFAVGMLEVLAVTGTWLLLTDPRLRWEAGAAVLLASGVTATGGVLAYGLFGLTPSACSLIVVHLIARAWASEPATGRAQQEPRTVADLVAAAPRADPPAEAPPSPAVEQPPAPAPAPGPAPPEAAIVADLRGRPALPGRDALKREFRIGTKKADRILAAARRPALVQIEATP